MVAVQRVLTLGGVRQPLRAPQEDRCPRLQRRLHAPLLSRHRAEATRIVHLRCRVNMAVWKKKKIREREREKKMHVSHRADVWSEWGK